MKSKFTLLMTITISFFCVIQAKSQTVFDVETGLVVTGYNNVRIPGNTGTLFSLKNDLDANPGFFYRLRVSHTFNSRHTLSLLYAPLKLRSDGRFSDDLIFENVTFPAGTELKGVYKFNSYRLTYRYELIRTPSVTFGLGLTAKIRDASISLKSASLFSEKTNVGFVPLVNFRMLWHPGTRLGLLVDGDALAAKQGRAEDVLVAATYDVSGNLRLKAGYRILEGGADNAEVYNFALLNYFSVGCLLQF